MADIDLKTESPDASINDSAFLFGADSQSAASPSVYSVGTVRAHFVGAGSVSVASGKTLTASNTLTLAGTDGTTMTFPSTSATLARTDAGNTFTGAQTFSVGTVNGTGLNLTQTWSGTGTYTGLQYNVTDSGPANAASLLLDLQVGGTTQFNVAKNGAITIRGTNNGNHISFLQSGGIFCGTTIVLDSSPMVFRITNNEVARFVSNEFRLVSAASLSWNADLFLTRRGAANLRLGAADAASPAAQTLSVQSVVAGTSNTAGANLTITGSQGTGTGAGGSIIFQVAPAGSSGTAQNALATALTIASDNSFTLGGTNASIIGPGNTGRLTFTGVNASLSYGGVNNTFGIALTSPNGGTNTNLVVHSVGTIGFSSTSNANAAMDTILARDAANTLALRNGTNAQVFNIYNTFTDASNYERGFIRWSSNILQIGGDNAGTGSAREVRLIHGSGFRVMESGSTTSTVALFTTTRAEFRKPVSFSSLNSAHLTSLASGVINVSAAGDGAAGASVEFVEQTAPAAPDANRVRIYAEDNGSGKTRLMALFATGAAQQIAIEP